MTRKLSNLVKSLHWVGLLLLCGLYLAYVAFLIRNDRGPVDYETFRTIGQHFLHHEPVYYENSYYPMPFVMVFAVLAWLPRPVSMAGWLLAPVVAAVAICRWQAFVLLFAPLFGHFVGGQTAVFGMVGMWGYRRYMNPDRRAGGFYLALMTVKPQLALIPCIWALFSCGTVIRQQRRVPAQAWAFLISAAILYLPGFLFYPDWPLQWLSRPRPLFARAMSGLLPRALLEVATRFGWAFWGLLIALATGLLFTIWLLNRRELDFDLFVLWSFIINPLVHDYDLVQIVPLLDTPLMQRVALLASIPGWWVILTAYTNDAAWAVFTIIAPVLLFTRLLENARRRSAGPPPKEQTVALAASV